jgi:hypothetical protein
VGPCIGQLGAIPKLLEGRPDRSRAALEARHEVIDVRDGLSDEGARRLARVAPGHDPDGPTAFTTKGWSPERILTVTQTGHTAADHLIVSSLGLPTKLAAPLEFRHE